MWLTMKWGPVTHGGFLLKTSDSKWLPPSDLTPLAGNSEHAATNSETFAASWSRSYPQPKQHKTANTHETSWNVTSNTMTHCCMLQPSCEVFVLGSNAMTDHLKQIGLQIVTSFKPIHHGSWHGVVTWMCAKQCWVIKGELNHSSSTGH